MKALLLILVLAVGCHAQKVKEGKAITEWVPVSPGVSSDTRIEGDGKMLMSFAHIKRSDDTFKGWVRFVFPSSAIVIEGKWNEARFYISCDCRKNEIKALSGIAYGLDGSIRSTEDKQILEPTAPGSIGRELFEFFCERGGPPSVAPTLKPK